MCSGCDGPGFCDAAVRVNSKQVLRRPIRGHTNFGKAVPSARGIVLCRHGKRSRIANRRPYGFLLSEPLTPADLERRFLSESVVPEALLPREARVAH
jgi:hypothetical protein